jgi:tetratricopeptide (TPR) repeat protein
MRKFPLLLFALSLVCGRALSQYSQWKEASLMEEMKRSGGKASAVRVDIGCELMVRHLPVESIYDSLMNVLTEEVESSRDRALMCRLYSKIAQNFVSLDLFPEYVEKSRSYIDKCRQIAMESNLNEYKVAALLLNGRYYLAKSQNQKALDYNNQAVSIASALGSDSLQCVAQDALADTWASMSNKISQFQCLLIARDLADRSGVRTLIERGSYNLAQFFEGAGEFERAKDYFTQCKDKAEDWGHLTVVFSCLRSLGRCYLAQKNEKLGLSYYNKALKLADSLGLANLSLKVNVDLLNYYFSNNDPEVGFAFFEKHSELIGFIKRFGLAYQLNKLYSLRYAHRKMYDSALYYLRVAEPFEYNPKTSYTEKFNFSFQLAAVLENMRRYEEARDVLEHARAIAVDTLQDLNAQKMVSIELDSVYERLGDYKKAEFYLSTYNRVRDSLETLSKQKDLMNIEIENAAQRAEQQKIKQAEAMRTRNNLEYLGITALLATIFIVLVVFGVFKISPAVIKGLGFFAFIFLFEFIVLLLDEQIHEITHGEPWKVLGVKVVIIALLLPLHHWLEERMLHYLTHKAHMLRGRLAAGGGKKERVG